MCYEMNAKYWPCLAVNGVGMSTSLVVLDDQRRGVYSQGGPFCAVRVPDRLGHRRGHAATYSGSALLRT